MDCRAADPDSLRSPVEGQSRGRPRSRVMGPHSYVHPSYWSHLCEVAGPVADMSSVSWRETDGRRAKTRPAERMRNVTSSQGRSKMRADSTERCRLLRKRLFVALDARSSARCGSCSSTTPMPSCARDAPGCSKPRAGAALVVWHGCGRERSQPVASMVSIRFRCRGAETP